jgi:glycerophosphoryl diester phosphodiesterase
MKRARLAAAAALLLLGAGFAGAADIRWMAHRGGGLYDRPDNTIAAFEYAWSLGGIPEADVQPTKDGVFVCLHDATLERTGAGPASLLKTPVDSLDWAAVKDVDVGSKFSAEYAAERVPLLEQVFARMAGRPERSIFLDLKTNELERLTALIKANGLEGRVYISSPSIAQCREIKARMPGVKTLLWCGGTPFEIKKKFDAARGEGFAGIDQIQLHLNPVSLGKGWKYAVDADYLGKAAAAAGAAGIEFQVYPKSFESRDLSRLLELGIAWFVSDEPARFLETMAELGAMAPAAASN